MPSELLVTAALANCGRDAPTREFALGLAEQVPDVAIFRFQPSLAHGIQVKAALDWQAVLGTAADLLAFASAIWAAYERFVKPKREKHQGEHKPLLFLQLRRGDGSFLQFSLGNDIQDREVFVEQFVRQVSELRAVETPDGKSLLTAVSENESWVRVSVRRDGDS